MEADLDCALWSFILLCLSMAVSNLNFNIFFTYLLIQFRIKTPRRAEDRYGYSTVQVLYSTHN